MKNITIEEILQSPYKYEDMLVHVKYRTYWKNKGNEMRQDVVYYTGRITLVNTKDKIPFSVIISHGFFIFLGALILIILIINITIDRKSLK